MITSLRIKKVREKMSYLGLDGLFISNQENITYLTNFPGLSYQVREAFLFITKKNAYLYAFPTFYSLYKSPSEEFQIKQIKIGQNLHQLLNQEIKKEKVKKIGYEIKITSVEELAKLRRKVEAKFYPTKDLVEKFRIIKDDQEITLIKKAAKITDMAFSYIIQKIKKGITEKELSLLLEFFIKRKTSDVAFSPIVAFNQSAAIPHYLPSDKKKLKNKSLILLDFGAKVNNYCADMTRAVFFGSPNEKIVGLHKAVLKAQIEAIKQIKPGLTGRKADQIARKILHSNGLNPYPHGLGHGVGVAIHEAPRLNINSSEVLAENMVFTIEPGIYIEDQYGIRIEDLVVLRKNGVEILTKSTKELVIL